MIRYDNTRWLKVTFSWYGTSLPHIYPRLLLIIGIALAIWGVMLLGVNVPKLEPLGHSMIGIALGMLLVFRNGSSYERYMEGRRAWGAIMTASRNLARLTRAQFGTPAPFANLMTAFVLALKDRLREENNEEELRSWLDPALADEVAAASNRPLRLAQAMSDELQRRVQDGSLPVVARDRLEGAISDLVASQGACERIRNTPIPFCHSAHIKQLLFVYLGSLPFVMVPAAGLMGVVLSAIVSFALIGIEESGVEIEDPFGTDPNDLPIDAFCKTLSKESGAVRL